MLRIVGIQRSENAESEFVLLQNQASLRIPLRGHAVISNGYVERECISSIHAFSEEEQIHSGAYVMLRTGFGESRWGTSRDGSHVFYVFMGRSNPIWQSEVGALSVMHVQHCFEERSVYYSLESLAI
jgi:hypothetical protein